MFDTEGGRIKDKFLFPFQGFTKLTGEMSRSFRGETITDRQGVLQAKLHRVRPTP